MLYGCVWAAFGKALFKFSHKYHCTKAEGYINLSFLISANYSVDNFH